MSLFSLLKNKRKFTFSEFCNVFLVPIDNYSVHLRDQGQREYWWDAGEMIVTAHFARGGQATLVEVRSRYPNVNSLVPSINGVWHVFWLSECAPVPHFNSRSALPLPTASKASSRDHLSCYHHSLHLIGTPSVRDLPDREFCIIRSIFSQNLKNVSFNMLKQLYICIF